MSGLTIETGESLVLDEGEFLSGLGGLANDGDVSGLGAVGLVWRELIGGSAPERVVCRIVEEDVPELVVEAEGEGMKVAVSCGDVGAAAYLAVCGEDETAMTVRNGRAAGNVWAEEDGDCLVIVRAVNSRGNAVSASITVPVYAGTARYRVVKDLFPLRAFRPEEELVFMARITDRRTGAGVKRTDVAGISYSCFDVVKNVNGIGRKPIEGKERLSAGVGCLSDIISVMEDWQRDDVGGNFRFVPGVNLGDWLGKVKGVFDVTFSVLMKNGAKIEFEWSVIEERSL